MDLTLKEKNQWLFPIFVQWSLYFHISLFIKYPDHLSYEAVILIAVSKSAGFGSVHSYGQSSGEYFRVSGCKYSQVAHPSLFSLHAYKCTAPIPSRRPSFVGLVEVARKLIPEELFMLPFWPASVN